MLTLLGLAAKSGALAFGKDMLRAYISDHRMRKKIVIIAKDAGERVKRDLRIRCELRGVPMLELLSKEQISKAVGKRHVAAVGLLNENMVEGALNVLRELQEGSTQKASS